MTQGQNLGKFTKWLGGVSSVAVIGAMGWIYHSNLPEEYTVPISFDTSINEPVETAIDTPPPSVLETITLEENAESFFIVTPSPNYTFEIPEDIYEAAYLRTRTIQTDNGAISVPTNLQDIFISCSTITGMPPGVLAQKAFVESSFRPEIRHEGSGARGLMQFLPKTALEILYDMGQNAQYAEIFPVTQLVTRHKVNDIFFYGVSIGVDEDRLIRDSLNDPLLSTCMAAEYNKKYLTEFAEDFPSITEITSLHSYFVHWLGPNGARTMMRASLEDPNQNAVLVVSGGAEGQIVQNHKSIFYDDDENPRSVSEMLNYLSENRGIGNITIELGTIESDINIVYSGADLDGLASQWAIASPPRPTARPDNLIVEPTQEESPLAVTRALRPMLRPQGLGES